jgi:predicted nucleic acid-binding protein
MFVDTNVLVYASARGAPCHDRARAAPAGREALRISRQVLREFIAVVTRPQMWANPRTAAEAAFATAVLERDFVTLEDNPIVWNEFIGLCHHFDFGGRQVHDAYVVATMLAHGERRLLTFNGSDFRRFEPAVQLVVP